MSHLFGKSQLPASAFPACADQYLCDKCGRDLTKHIHPGRAHVWQAMGPARYQCECGEKYLTGAAEWDHLGPWERRNRIFQTISFALMLSTISTVITFAILVVAYRGAWTSAILWVVAALPMAVIVPPFLFSVAASIVRTRF